MKMKKVAKRKTVQQLIWRKTKSPRNKTYCLITSGPWLFEQLRPIQHVFSFLQNYEIALCGPENRLRLQDADVKG